MHIVLTKYQLTIVEHDEDRYYYELTKGYKQVSWDEWDAKLSITFNEVQSGKWLTEPASAKE